MLGVIIIGTLISVTVGTLVSGMTLCTKTRQTPLRIALIPLIIFTVVLPAVVPTSKVISRGGDLKPELRILGGFAVVSLLLAYLDIFWRTDMEGGKMIDIVLAILAATFVAATILAAFYYAPLEPLDVLTVVQKPSDYTGDDIRVKGVVRNWDGGRNFSIADITSHSYEMNVSYSGSDSLAGITDGTAVYVLGTLTSSGVLRAKQVEIADDPDTPAGWISPYSAKIFYFHVPAAWTSFLAFGIVLACSVAYLWKGGQKWDIWAHSSAEVGLVFCTVAVISGALWAKAEWGYYWDWSEVKLFSTFVLWLVFMAYVAIRSGPVQHESIPRIAAIFGILGFAAVPISFLSSRIWASIHPNVVATSQGHLSSEAGFVLLLGVLAFTFVFATLFSRRVAVERSIMDIQELKEKLEAGE